MNVLVTGGTGTLGRDVVMLLRQSGHRARILSREPRGHVDAVQGDLKTCAGLPKALPGSVALPSGWQFQPVEPREVARRVVNIVLDKPAGMLPDFGGPQVRDFRSIAESWLAARKERRRLMNLWLPFKASRQVAEGRLTCPEHKDGLVTLDQYLAEKYGP